MDNATKIAQERMDARIRAENDFLNDDVLDEAIRRREELENHIFEKEVADLLRYSEYA